MLKVPRSLQSSQPFQLTIPLFERRSGSWIEVVDQRLQVRGPPNSLTKDVVIGTRLEVEVHEDARQLPPEAAVDREHAVALDDAAQIAVDGFAALINKPGLGIAVSEPALAKYSEETL